MPTGIWTSFLLVLAGMATAAWLVARVYEGGVRPVRGLEAFFGRQSKTDRVLLGAFFLVLWIVAGAKPDGVAGRPALPDANSVGRDVPVAQDAEPWADFTPATSTNTNAARTLAEEDFVRGFVMHRVGTGEAFDFAAPPGATVCADWEAFGAAEDWMYFALDNWTATLGTNEVYRFRVYSFGKAQPCVTNEAGSIETNRWFAPFRTSLGVVPRANWRMIAGNGNATADEELAPSRFWHFVTPSNTLLLTWQNALLGRATNTPVNVQMELWPSGRFAYRYDLSRLDAGEVTNVLVGASLGGPAWTTNALPTDVTSLAFHPLTVEDAANPDRDGDGLSLADELLVHSSNFRGAVI